MAGWMLERGHKRAGPATAYGSGCRRSGSAPSASGRYRDAPGGACGGGRRAGRSGRGVSANSAASLQLVNGVLSRGGQPYSLTNSENGFPAALRRCWARRQGRQRCHRRMVYYAMYTGGIRWRWRTVASRLHAVGQERSARLMYYRTICANAGKFTPPNRAVAPYAMPRKKLPTSKRWWRRGGAGWGGGAGRKFERILAARQDAVIAPDGDPSMGRRNDFRYLRSKSKSGKTGALATRSVARRK